MEGFITEYNKAANAINEWAERKGWNSANPKRNTYGHMPPEERLQLDEDADQLSVHYDIMQLGLMVTEISEAIEGRRHGDPASDKIPEFTSQEEELADCIIRIMHYSAERGLRVAEALEAKAAYNEGRPYRHGKLA